MDFSISVGECYEVSYCLVTERKIPVRVLDITRKGGVTTYLCRNLLSQRLVKIHDSRRFSKHVKEKGRIACLDSTICSKSGSVAGRLGQSKARERRLIYG